MTHHHRPPGCGNVALTPSGQVITCDGCGTAVERVTDAMTDPVPDDIARDVYGRYPGELVYIACAPLPDGTQPCLGLALLADEMYERTRCRVSGCRDDRCHLGSPAGAGALAAAGACSESRTAHRGTHSIGSRGDRRPRRRGGSAWSVTRTSRVLVATARRRSPWGGRHRGLFRRAGAVTHPGLRPGSWVSSR